MGQTLKSKNTRSVIVVSSGGVVAAEEGRGGKARAVATRTIERRVVWASGNGLGFGLGLEKEEEIVVRLK